MNQMTDNLKKVHHLECNFLDQNRQNINRVETTGWKRKHPADSPIKNQVLMLKSELWRGDI